jgi:hypothetical protein
MNATAWALEALSANTAGHWGVVRTAGAEPIADTDPEFRKLHGDRHVACLHLQCRVIGQLHRPVCLACRETGEVHQPGIPTNFPASELDRHLDHLLAASRSDGRRLARLLITDFDAFSPENQCVILRLSRAVRDRTSDVKLQTIVWGAWNFFRVQRYWRKYLANTFSPAPDRNHVHFGIPHCIETIRSKLLRRNLVPAHLDRFHEVCVEVLHETTGGDAILLDYIIRSLAARHLSLSELESVLLQALNSEELITELERRCKGLSPTAWSILAGVLQRTIACYPQDDPDLEDLRLAGLVALRPAGGNNWLVSAEPLVDRVFRHNWGYLARGQHLVDSGLDLAWPLLALNTAAYRTISEIENTLRNVLVLSLKQQSPDDWTQQIQGVRTLAHDGGEIPNELLGLARQIREACLPFVQTPSESQSKPVEAARATEPPPAHDTTQKKTKQTSLVEAAKDWRRRNQSNTVLQLADDSLIYYFTTEGLASLLVNEKQNIYARAIRPYFPNKHELATFLEHYIAIRAAVAHNQPITLSTFKRLDTMRDDLNRRLCQASP